MAMDFALERPADAGRPTVHPTGHDRARAFRVARRHSMMVRALKVLLPVAALALLSLYVVFANLSVTIGDTRASVASVSVSTDNLTMTRPKMEGVTSDRAHYVITSATARQDFKHPELIHMNDIDALITQTDGEWVKMISQKGRFHDKKQMLHLEGGIRVTKRDGMKARLVSGDLNVKTQVFVTGKPVVVEMLNGTVWARTMRLAMKDRIVQFAGDVRVHLVKSAASAAGGAARTTNAASANSDSAGLVHRPKRSIPKRLDKLMHKQGASAQTQ